MTRKILKEFSDDTKFQPFLLYFIFDYYDNEKNIILMALKGILLYFLSTKMYILIPILSL